jgi:uncharacterized membrane protein YjjP (DUF1212 family)
MSEIIEGQDTVKKAKRLFWPIFCGITLVVAMVAFIPSLRHFLYGGNWEAFLVFVLASFALIKITPRRETLSKTEGDQATLAIVTYFVLTGMGYTWVCVFLWFSRRYTVFSGPVVGAMVLILALYAAIGFVVALLTGGNWRTALLTFGIALSAPSIIVLRLHLLR